MKYKNTKTGVIITSPSKVSGGDWIEWKGETKDSYTEDTIVPGEVKKDEYVEEEIDLEAMTKDQLIEFAKEQEIQINPKDKKAEIIETIVKAFN